MYTYVCTCVLHCYFSTVLNLAFQKYLTIENNASNDNRRPATWIPRFAMSFRQADEKQCETTINILQSYRNRSRYFRGFLPISSDDTLFSSFKNDLFSIDFHCLFICLEIRDNSKCGLELEFLQNFIS